MSKLLYINYNNMNLANDIKCVKTERSLKHKMLLLLNREVFCLLIFSLFLPHKGSKQT
jgi:hypothetical protein